MAVMSEQRMCHAQKADSRSHLSMTIIRAVKFLDVVRLFQRVGGRDDFGRSRSGRETS